MRKSLVSHLLVALQFTAIGIGLVPWAGSPQGTPAWLVLSVLGGLIGIYTLAHNRLGNFAIYPEPLEQARLITSGPYRWVRHPMYLALLLFMTGIAAWNDTPYNLASLPALLIAIFGKMQREERYLRERFTEYADYCRHSKRLIPFIY